MTNLTLNSSPVNSYMVSAMRCKYLDSSQSLANSLGAVMVKVSLALNGLSSTSSKFRNSVCLAFSQFELELDSKDLIYSPLSGTALLFFKNQRPFPVIEHKKEHMALTIRTHEMLKTYSIVENSFSTNSTSCGQQSTQAV